MAKLKIAIIAPARLPVPPVKGGAIETLTEAIIKQNEIYEKCEITVYSAYDKNALKEAEKYKNTTFTFIKVNKLGERLYDIFRRMLKKIFKINTCSCFTKKLLTAISRKQYDKIIIEGNKEYVLPIKTRTHHDNIYFHEHHDAFRNTEKDKKIIKACKKVIVISDYIKKQTLNTEGAEDSNVAVLKNCIDINLFKKEQYLDYRRMIREKYGIAKHETAILFSGRILPIKGVKELILAFKNLSENAKAKLLIVGNAGFGDTIRTEYDDELIKISEEIKDKIIFSGFIHNNDLPKIHAACDIAVVPSIWEEPAGLVVIEAMASELPLIVTDSGGIPEFICGEGVIIVKRDEKLIFNLTDALNRLINNENLRKQMGRAGRTYVQKFNFNNYYNEFIKIISD